MVSIVSQLRVCIDLDIYMLYINFFCSVQSRFTLACKKLMRYPFPGCFLGANVAV